MDDLERKKRLIVTALGAQQIYAQCHDECIDLNFFKHDLKMYSKNLVAKLERELMPIFGVLGDVDGGESYVKTIELMEVTLQSLATLPVEYWALVNKGIIDIKRQIDEKNQAGDNGVPSGETQDVEPRADRSDDGVVDKLKFTEVEEYEEGRDRRASRKMQK